MGGRRGLPSTIVCRVCMLSENVVARCAVMVLQSVTKSIAESIVLFIKVGWLGFLFAISGGFHLVE